MWYQFKMHFFTHDHTYLGFALCTKNMKLWKLDDKNIGHFSFLQNKNSSIDSYIWDKIHTLDTHFMKYFCKRNVADRQQHGIRSKVVSTSLTRLILSLGSETLRRALGSTTSLGCDVTTLSRTPRDTVGVDMSWQRPSNILWDARGNGSRGGIIPYQEARWGTY